MWVPHAWNQRVNETWVSWDRYRRNFLLCTMFVFLIFVREVFSLSLSVDTRQRLNYVNHWFSICVLFFFQVSFLSFTLFVLEIFLKPIIIFTINLCHLTFRFHDKTLNLSYVDVSFYTIMLVHHCCWRSPIGKSFYLFIFIFLLFFWSYIGYETFCTRIYRIERIQ